MHRLLKFIRPFVAIIAGAFIVHAGLGLYRSWDGASIHVGPAYFVGALFFALLAMQSQLMAWRALVATWTGKKMPAAKSAQVYLDSQMARYTPGKVGLPAVRIAGAEALGVSAKVMASTLLVELFSWCAMGSITAGLVLGFVADSSLITSELSLLSQVAAGGSIVALVALTVLDRQRLPRKLLEVFDAQGEGPLVPWRLPAYHLLHFGSWIGCGGLLARSVSGAPLMDCIFVGAILCVAIVAGFLALFAPAGAGIREALIAVATAPLLGSAGAISVGLLARIVSLMSDVGLWAFFRLRAKSKP